MYAQGEMVENAHVLRGVQNHERTHTPGYESDAAGVRILRRIYVYSHRLCITGFCDLVEEHVDGVYVPVEYKQGKQGKWDNDEVQLCAQALCLEEMTKKIITFGHIFYFGSRRRVTVDFTAELRQQTEEVIAAMHRAVALGDLPAHTSKPIRCQGCSIIDICLPQETNQLVGDIGDTHKP